MIRHLIFVTGAGSGIGLATAEELHARGATIVALGRRPEPLKSLKGKLRSRTFAFSLDLTQGETVLAWAQSLAAGATDLFGEKLLLESYDLISLVNNAGIYVQQLVAEGTDEHWLGQFATNLHAPVRLSRALLPALRARPGSSIVNVASTLALRPAEGAAAYSAAKAALVSFTQTLALEEAKAQVRVNCVCPGLVETPIHSIFGKHDARSEALRTKFHAMQPMGRMGTTAEIARAIAYFALPGSEWTTGSILSVDGGINLV